ncbi:MAG: hypothetical protein JWR60_1974 [Polaromonas sp.]|nr:hypothetical protein [Polaromonas sp.]
MMRQLIQKAKIMVFEHDEMFQGGVRRMATHLRLDPSGQPDIDRHMTPEQRIRLLEIQNQQLQVDVNLWKTTSLKFAQELRELLKD